MTKKLTDIFATAEVPAVLCIANGDTSADEITFSKVTDVTGDKKVMLLANNATSMKSPITGEDISVSDTVEPETASFNKDETLSSFVCVANCVGCNHDLYVTAEVAEAIDNKAIFCTNCGEKVVAFYDGDLVIAEEDPENPDETDDNEGEITDALDGDDDDAGDDDTTDGNAIGEGANAGTEEKADSDNSDDTSDDSDTSEDDNGDDNSDDTGDDDADASEDDTVTDDTTDDSDDTGDSNSDDDTSDDQGDSGDAVADDEDDALDEEEENAATVVVASTVDFADQTLYLASLADVNNRYEVFIGGTHIGSLLKDESTENVQRIFNNQNSLRAAFGSSFWKSVAAIEKNDFEALASYGFKPAKVTIPFNKVVAQEIAALTEEHETKIDEAVKEATDKVVATLKIAMAGIDKGMYKGPNLFSEVAKLLKSYSVQNFEEASARFTENFSAAYLQAVVAQADVLRKENPEFVRGVARSIEMASYSFDKRAVANPSDYAATSSLLADVSSAKRETPVKKTTSPPNNHAPTDNRFRSIFKQY